MIKRILYLLMIFSLLFMVSCDSWKEVTATIVAGGITSYIAPPNACTFEQASAINLDLRARILNSSKLKKKSVRKAFTDKGFGSSLCVALVLTTFEVGTADLDREIYGCAGDFLGAGLTDFATNVCSKVNI